MPINLPCLLPSSLDISNIFVLKKELSCNSFSFLFLLSKYIQITLKKFWLHRSNVKGFSIKGFALVYDENLYKEKLVRAKIDDRSLIIFQSKQQKHKTHPSLDA